METSLTPREAGASEAHAYQQEVAEDAGVPELHRQVKRGLQRDRVETIGLGLERHGVHHLQRAAGPDGVANRLQGTA